MTYVSMTYVNMTYVSMTYVNMTYVSMTYVNMTYVSMTSPNSTPRALYAPKDANAHAHLFAKGTSSEPFFQGSTRNTGLAGFAQNSTRNIVKALL